MEDQGITDFSAFFHMATRTLIKRFEEEKTMPTEKVERILTQQNQQLEALTQRIDQLKASEDKGDYKTRK